MWNSGDPHALLVEIENGTATLENNLTVFYRIKHILTYDPATPPLDIYPKDMQMYIHMKTSTQMFIATLLITTENGKQVKYLSTRER